MSVNQAGCQAKQSGFTLVELAIVLVIIGLILGMAFKGKDLIDGAKVKSIAAQYNKVQAAFNTYFERYGSYPGDGCTAAPAAGATTCPTGAANPRSGVLNTVIETAAAITLLQNTNLLSASDLQSPFGGAWGISISGNATLGLAGVNYLSLTNPATGIPIVGADARDVCALDKMIDDGVFNAGNVRSSAPAAYTAATLDCWATSAAAALPGGPYTIGMRLLP
jgi:prepilin-type N-terminal cleavage/methylation domain-containing protein